ncbi:hypothetical protein B0T16DRAFT_462354 [Cercophora newfieldiana]|uniref:Uncharacterized protein n=1 Tax=Cercophora newfieldiana TaxID=92897 RepID=A0AA40CIC7_9PEZI|nr:hypothetical protein B0T16DRAFT_462354 [Cercophora newfieldiana]
MDSRISTGFNNTGRLFAYESYASNLNRYTSRTLGNQGDVLRAIAGIMRRDSEMMQSSMLEGLPVRAIETFMSFSGHNLRRRPGFPSYSWAGWIGGVEVLIDPKFSLVPCDLVWIFWYKLSPGSLMAERVWEEDSDTAIFNDIVRDNGRGISSFLFSGLGLSTSQKEPTFTYNGPSLSYPLLQFWTASVFLKVSDVDVFNQSADLTGSDGAVCGHVLFDGYEETTFFDDNEQFELLLICGGGSILPEGEPSTPNSDTEEFEWYIFSGGGAMLPGGDPSKPKSYLEYYRVIVIEWMASGVAERRGIGRIGKEAVAKSFAPGPVWEEILLG